MQPFWKDSPGALSSVDFRERNKETGAAKLDLARSIKTSKGSGSHLAPPLTRRLHPARGAGGIGGRAAGGGVDRGQDQRRRSIHVHLSDADIAERIKA